jgi:4-alpha-glucanotransferase
MAKAEDEKPARGRWRAPADDAVRRAAAAYGVLPSYVDGLGTRRDAPLDVLRDVLAALEVDPLAPPPRPPRVAPRSPPRAQPPPRGRSRGLLANLYTVRGAADQGFGDVAALSELVAIAARRGFQFVGVNPLHAIRHTEFDCSPYWPQSRLFRDALYLDPLRVPEIGPAGTRSAVLAALDGAELRRARRLDHPRLAARRHAALSIAHQAFLAKAPPARRRAFERFRARSAPALDDFATFQAIEERHGIGFSRWPAALRDPRSPATRAFATEHAARVSYFAWLQFELDRQLEECGEQARAAGMAIGIYGDLAVGSAPDSADLWMHPEQHVEGFTLGAPPDLYSPLGQAWGFPPLDPLRMRRERGAYFARLVAAAMRGCGALRIDHAIGLVRQYWIPKGAAGDLGVMVEMPSAVMLARIAAASRRAHCCVIGEDLGAVPPELRPLLARYGLLRSVVMLFERDGAGFLSPSKYPRDALATVATHDVPPLAGFARGVELPVRRALGLLASAAALARARRERRADVATLLAMLRKAVPRASRANIVDAAHAALDGAASRLIGFALDDVGGERLPINVPTATPDRHPVWSRRMRRDLRSIDRDGSWPPDQT